MKFLHQRFWKKHYTLVISWGWVRGFYALGILKALEECGVKKHISALYGVSVGAILGAYRSAGYSADWIFERFSDISLFWIRTINIFSQKSLLKSDFLSDMFLEDLPKDFKKLSIPLSIWVTDTKKGKYLLYKTGNLITPLLWSMAIPGVFPPIPFKWSVLMDGGLINNFPVDLAKKDHPSNRIIWIFLNKFTENQKPDTLLKSLSISYEILMRSRYIDNFDLVDSLFYRDLHIPILSNNKKHMKSIFDMWYEDGMKKFW